MKINVEMTEDDAIVLFRVLTSEMSRAKQAAWTLPIEERDEHRRLGELRDRIWRQVREAKEEIV